MQKHHLEAPLYGAEDLQRKVRALAGQMADGADGRILTLIGILRGSFIFLADLVRALHALGVPLRIDFMMLASYGAGTTSSGTVQLVKDFGLDVGGEHVVLVDDILDTGRTLAFAKRHTADRGAARVETCVLLDKPARRVAPIEADYRGYEVPDEFIVGYGLDYDGRYRELPFLTRVAFDD